MLDPSQEIILPWTERSELSRLQDGTLRPRGISSEDLESGCEYTQEVMEKRTNAAHTVWVR